MRVFRKIATQMSILALAFGSFVAVEPAKASSPQPMVLVYKIESANTDVRITVFDVGTVSANFSIDWGIENQPAQTGLTAGLHTQSYATVGTYTITLTGTIPGFGLPDDAEEDLREESNSNLQKVSSFGDVGLISLRSAFSGAINLEEAPPTLPTTVTDLTSTFFKAEKLNQDLNGWETANVTKMGALFEQAKAFNGDISQWNTSKVTNMSHMFSLAESFNQNIGNWDTSSATDMSFMFRGAINFNNGETAGQHTRPMNWDTSKVTDMPNMFNRALAFNQDINTRHVGGLKYWDTSSVVDMERMFWEAREFNRPVGNWDTSKVENMSRMFEDAAVFDQPIGTWNTSKVEDMRRMFRNAKVFNQPLGTWDTSKVTGMFRMLQGAEEFNQNLGSLSLASLVSGPSSTNPSNSLEEMLDNTKLSVGNYDLTLVGWAAHLNALGSSAPKNIGLGAQGLNFCAQTARTALIGNFDWTINGDQFLGAAACAAPGAPTNVNATSGDSSALVEWDAPTDGGTPTSYTVTTSPDGASCTATHPATSCTVTGLTNGIAYTFTVTATNTTGNSAPSAPSSAVTPAPAAPGAPTNVTATSGNGSALVEWDAPTDGGTPTSYTVTADPGSASCTATHPTTSCTVTGLDNGTDYAFTVTATNTTGSSSPSTPSSAVTPSGVSVDAGAASAPFAGPVITRPAQQATAGQTVTLAGSNLAGVTGVLVGTERATLVRATASAIEFTLPTTLAAGSYDLVLESSTGRVTIQAAIRIGGALSSESRGAWTRASLNPDGSVSSVRFYAKDPIGIGKVQFKVNGREIAWIRAIDETDPKLRTRANGLPYLVRTITLAPGKNALEIFVDGVRIWRAAYTGR